MTLRTTLKLAMVLGVILMIPGCTNYVWGNVVASTYFWLAGGVMYGGGRLALWLTTNEQKVM